MDLLQSNLESLYQYLYWQKLLHLQHFSLEQSSEQIRPSDQRGQKLRQLTLQQLAKEQMLIHLMLLILLLLLHC
ncbi:MAG: hypothetical protein EBT28_07410 [Betaproteobacteria bacterium]|nr:hypothetical protein [Betaproteobacteria bacterium]